MLIVYLILLIFSFTTKYFKCALTILERVKNIMFQFGVVKNGNVVELQHVLLKAVNHVPCGIKRHQIHLLLKMAKIVVRF